MKKMFLMLALVMGLSISGCQKEPDERCQCTESTWEENDSKEFQGNAENKILRNVWIITEQNQITRTYYSHSRTMKEIRKLRPRQKVTKGVYTTSESLCDPNGEAVDSWQPNTSYQVKMYLPDDADDSIMRDQRMTVNVFYPGYVMNGQIGTILVEVSTDEEIFVGSTSFVAEGSLNLVHGISHASTVTVSLEYFDGKIWLEFYTGATREHYENRPADHSGTFTGPTTISFTFTRDMKTIPQRPMKPEPEQPESTDEDTPSLPDTPESQTSTERDRLYPGPERAEDTEMDTEVETEEAEEETEEAKVGGEAEVDTEETMSQAQRNDLCFFPSRCYSGNHIAMCDVALDDYLRATGSTLCECPRRNSGIHRSRCPYNGLH